MLLRVVGPLHEVGLPDEKAGGAGNPIALCRMLEEDILMDTYGPKRVLRRTADSDRKTGLAKLILRE